MSPCRPIGWCCRVTRLLQCRLRWLHSYRRVPVAHVEAGLRTFDLARPFPEEANRRIADALATVHFAPTELARRNLLREGANNSIIYVTGNTVVDALLTVGSLSEDGLADIWLSCLGTGASF